VLPARRSHCRLMPLCSFGSEGISFKLKGKRNYTHWIHRVIKEHHALPGDLAFVFCSDEVLLRYNIQYLNHDTLTDIITFDYSENGTISGDILISIERVKENAASLKNTFDLELQRVMIHGVLHLLGFKDKSPAAKKAMRAAEDRALALFAQNL
jgi:rRNA maturation RNase YbeY